jgi:pyruvate dehydrogenase E2 component (dihydrolipoamide acetyltransferase)
MIELRLPSLGSDMDEGKLVEWHVRPGDAVRKGQIVAVVDTAKAAIDIECWHDGVVHALLIEPGTTIPVGTPMAVLRAAGESVEAVEREWAALKATAAGPVAAVVTAAVPAPAIAAPAAAGAARQRISPAARRLAPQLGVDVAVLQGHGAGGAVTLEDVQAAAQRQPPPAPAAAAPTRAQEMRKVIAAAMARSKREIPHYYLAEDIVLEHAMAWLAARNQGLPAVQRLLPAALLLKAVAVALQRYPEFNGFWRDGGFVAGGGIHLGVAISLREGGLVAPALHDAAGMDIASLTRSLLDLVKRTRAGALRSSELSDATITVTNLGDQGVASVFGVIYPPQVALVGFGRIALRPWADDTGVRALPVLTASLAADHRASDGHRGTLLLAEIREALQAPETLDAPR